jgi:4-hydroxybenzoyl-CoA reductase subunit beta
VSTLGAFDLVEPTSAEEAVALKASSTTAVYLGGGTDLVPNLRRGIGSPELVISIGRIADMSVFEEHDGELVIGAGVTIAVLERSALLRAHYPAIAMAAASIAGPGQGAAATVGGNLCLDTRCVFYNQSGWWRAANDFCLKKDGDVCHVAPKGDRCFAAFSGDLAPALLVLGAEVEVETGAGRQRRPLSELYRDDGRAHLALDPADLVVSVRVPAARGARSGYLKAGIRKAVDFPLAGVAVALSRDGEAITQLSVALTGTDTRPLLLEGLGELTGQPLGGAVLDGLARVVSRTIQPMRTTVIPAGYRKHVAGVLAQRLVSRLYAQSPPD